MKLLAPHSREFLTASIALVLVAGAATILMVVRASDAERQVAHTLEVREAARHLLSDLQDAEIGQRGFLLTGDETYLEPYNRAEASMAKTLANLRRLTSDNPAQQARLNELQALTKPKLDELRQTLVLERQGDHSAALAMVRTDRGKALMDGIRDELDAFSRTELDLLTSHEKAATTFREGLLALVCFSLIVALGLVGVLARATSQGVERLRRRTADLEVEIKLRRETEETLRQAQKMEAVGQLTGGIAHDFNNLLTIILGNIDTLRRRLGQASPAQDIEAFAAALAKPLDLAAQGARSAAQLTHRLLAFSRRQPLEPTRLDLNRLVSGMSELIRRTLGETIGIETIMAGGLWPTFADANQVENALINLCINARDAMPEGGQLTVETGTVYLDEAYARQFGDVTPGQYVLLSVTDTGTGMPPDVLNRAFEPFFTTKPEGQGSGLGLSMVHGFVKQSGGHIRIYSELGHGTTVKVYLPRLIEAGQAAAVPAPGPTAPPPGPQGGRNETVLVVEDNDGVREYVASVLKDLGYNVIEAADAVEALRLFSSSPPIDLLFTDVVLPGMNGRELAGRIRQLRADQRILFTTGYTRNAIIHQGRLDTDVEFLGKPFTQQDLARKVRELLDAKPAVVGSTKGKAS